MSAGARAWLAIVALTSAFAVTLGYLDPALDGDAEAEAIVTPLPDGQLALFEAEARHACARERGQNSGYVQLADGAIYCTDKHGRRAPRSVITIAEKVTR
jgi:hypothetical protein